MCDATFFAPDFVYPQHLFVQKRRRENKKVGIFERKNSLNKCVLFRYLSVHYVDLQPNYLDEISGISSLTQLLANLPKAGSNNKAQLIH